MTLSENETYFQGRYYKIYLMILFTTSLFSCTVVNVHKNKIEKIDPSEMIKKEDGMGSFSRCLVQNLHISENFLFINPVEIKSKYRNKQIIFYTYSPDVVFGDYNYYSLKDNEFYINDNNTNKILPDFPDGIKEFYTFSQINLKN